MLHLETFVGSVLQIILTTISTTTGPNETWSLQTIFNPYRHFYESLYLYLKQGHVVAIFMFSLIIHQSKQNICRQEYWNRDDCFIPICKHGVLLNLRNSNFQFQHWLDHTKLQGPIWLQAPWEWFVRTYYLKARVLQRRHGNETDSIMAIDEKNKHW